LDGMDPWNEVNGEIGQVCGVGRKEHPFINWPGKLGQTASVYFAFVMDLGPKAKTILAALNEEREGNRFGRETTEYSLLAIEMGT